MLVNQIAVYLENKPGQLDALVKAISGAGINMTSLNIADTSDFGIVRIITDDNSKAVDVIKKAGFTCGKSDIIGITVSNTVGTLGIILDRLKAANLSIEYLYSKAEGNDKYTMLFKTADLEKTEEILKDLSND